MYTFTIPLINLANNCKNTNDLREYIYIFSQIICIFFMGTHITYSTGDMSAHGKACDLINKMEVLPCGASTWALIGTDYRCAGAAEV